MTSRAGLLSVLLVACGPVADEGEGWLGDGWANPFPSSLLMDETGAVALRGLPDVDGVPVPVERLAWRRGFSPSQVAVVHIPGMDGAGLPHWRNPSPGEGSVRLYDRTAARWLPAFAELDAGVGPGEEPSLLIRPLMQLPPGHRIAVVVTTEVVDRPARFAALLSRRPPASLAPWREDAIDLIDELADAGMDRNEIAFAWDFPVDDPLTPLKGFFEDIATFEPEVVWTALREGGQAPPLAFRAAQGRFSVPSVLDVDGAVQIDAQGRLVADGTVDADLWVHVPLSAVGQPPGSVPVLIFGHGIFGAPEFYLDGDQATDVAQLAEAGPFIVVATRFTGLSRPDLNIALSAANNITRITRLTDRLAQAQVALRVLAEWVAAGGLDEAEVVASDAGDGAWARPGLPAYYGISLGGIQGALAVELGLPVEAAALHVPGSMWSTMLERSSNFDLFDGIVRNVVPSAAERAQLIAWTQLHWDGVDPMSGVSELGRVPVLLQEALHDEQVPNMTTRALARSAGMPTVGPVAEAPWGLEVVSAPHTAAPGAFVQYDPMRPAPVDTNRPAEVTDAHKLPRTWPGHRAQTIHFLHPETSGEVIHACGAEVCSPENRGG